MCLAILKPAKAVIPEDHLRQGWLHNSDGAGFAYVKGGKVVIEKGFMKYEDFLPAYTKAFNANKKSPFLIHFRIGTSGARNEEMTHPFPLTGGAIIHNGGISGTEAVWGTGKSDTCLFAEKYKDVLNFDLVTKNKTKFDEALGSNKLAMLFDDGKYALVNEKSGVWQGDIWYSNSSFRNYGSAHTGTYASRANTTATSTPLTSSPGASATANASNAYYEKHFNYPGMYHGD